MICNLCNKENKSVVRVNKWVVCKECSSEGPLRSALAAYDSLLSLRGSVTSTKAAQTEARLLQEVAEQRIQAAQEELDIAITALIPLVAKAEDARLEALKALAELNAFETEHPFLKN
jgi:hypothetical protein